MERFSIILYSLCSLAILAGSTPAGSSTIETLWDSIHDVGEHAKNQSSLNNASNTSNTTSTGNFSSSFIKDTQHSRRNDDREDDAYHKEGPSVGLSSHDILLDPDGLIPARLSRQAEKGDANYSTLASIDNISSHVKFNNDVVPPKRNPSYEGDLRVAEDRYPPPYPYWNPYYRGSFPNQRYRANDRREPYRNYWRYPVFPGK
ncbi:PREDICTED: uncharacterized protein LOC105459743 isoform X2 [Wasmannia auropunctata]|uniref:uncharacterized protein LOC105459743 isoform X2 n=1 Tax=Wasmannia auropunctata TaxID=64793 RepID=UPI0005EF1AF5|nr:PREDICTED: uncharacterized protein LOC105459743 isoform X2 [Wasmannia auropunctata]